jgi:hypothetical protein
VKAIQSDGAKLDAAATDSRDGCRSGSFFGSDGRGALEGLRGLIDLVKAFDENVSTEEGRDAIADCQDRAADAYDACMKDAEDDPLRGVSQLACGVVID